MNQDLDRRGLGRGEIEPRRQTALGADAGGAVRVGCRILLGGG
jgi:hypothetical protein